MKVPKSYIVIFILAVISALGAGFIGGYFTYHVIFFRNALPETPGGPGWLEVRGSKNLNSPRLDLIFMEPGNEFIFNENYTILPAGDGKIEGTLTIDNQPGNSVELALVLSPGRMTQRVITDRQGKFSIPIQKGNYFLNALMIISGKERLEGKILANQIWTDFHFCLTAPDPLSEEQLKKQFEALSEKLGPEGASRRMKDKFESGSGEVFPILVADSPVILPSFNYRDPIGVLTPKNGSAQAHGKNLEFIWEPVPTAKSYLIKLWKVEHHNDSSSSIEEFLTQGAATNTFSFDTATWAPGDYGYKIVAVGNNLQCLSVTQVQLGGMIEFSLK